jgi:hypothetical protein
MSSAAVMHAPSRVLPVSPAPPEAVEMTSTGFPFSYDFVLPGGNGTSAPEPTAYALGDLLAERPELSSSATFDVSDVRLDAETQTTTLTPEAKKKPSTSIDTTTKFTGLFLDTTIDCNKD